MAPKATAPFHFQVEPGVTRFFDVDDEVPVEVAVRVGGHVLDSTEGLPAAPVPVKDGKQETQAQKEAREAREAKEAAEAAEAAQLAEEAEKAEAEAAEITAILAQSVEKVLDWLDQCEDEDLKAKVLDAERNAEKPRKGIVGD